MTDNPNQLLSKDDMDVLQECYIALKYKECIFWNESYGSRGLGCNKFRFEEELVSDDSFIIDRKLTLEEAKKLTMAIDTIKDHHEFVGDGLNTTRKILHITGDILSFEVRYVLTECYADIQVRK